MSTLYLYCPGIDLIGSLMFVPGTTKVGQINLFGCGGEISSISLICLLFRKRRSLVSGNIFSPYFYYISSKLKDITNMPATNPIILSCPFPYALLVGKSSSRLMYTIIPATAPKRIPMMF